MNVIELRNVNALLIPDIQQLLKRAVTAAPFLAPAGFDNVAQDLMNFIIDPNQFMILGAESGKFQSVVLGYFPVGNLFPYPTIVLFYNEGSRKLSRATQNEVMDIVLSHGYTHLLAINSSGRKDEVWLRGLTAEGGTGKIAGSLAIFEVK